MTQRDLMAVLGEAVPELIIIGQTISERGEAADFRKRRTPDKNRCAERKVQRLQRGGLLASAR